jgi:carbonic anhydrase
MDIMDKIRLRQEQAVLPAHTRPPEHRPEVLYIGCVDARLDPVKDIGIGRGEALIFRNIGALVLKDTHASDAKVNQDHIQGGELPQSLSVGAVLEFYLHHIPGAPDKLKHIVVSGHTDCGGIRACQHGTRGEHDHYLPLYLESLKDIRKKVNEEAKRNGWDELRILHELEEESVRQSIHNLQTYPAVKRAMEAGKLAIHGWVINTATQQILEMNPQTLQFEPMVRHVEGA